MDSGITTFLPLLSSYKTDKLVPGFYLINKEMFINEVMRDNGSNVSKINGNPLHLHKDRRYCKTSIVSNK